jgi:anthranilate phosphoribosyltransferase
MKRDADPALAATDDTAELYARVIKRLGRNAREGSPGPLDDTDAYSLWRALLSRRFTPAQEAAVLMGLRVHGEGAVVLAAFARATADASAATPPLALPDTAPVVLHCLGSARRHPVLAPLLALRLAERDVPVLLITHEARQGVNAAQVLRRLAVRPSSTADEVARRLETERCAWWPMKAASPALARLLSLRAELGFRNSSHSALKLWSPMGPRSLIVANYTHAPYRSTFAEAVQQLRSSALLVRGTEGDPVAWQSAAHPPMAWLEGKSIDLPALQPSASTDADLPGAQDLDATVAFTQRALGCRQRVPSALAVQIDLLEHLSRVNSP